MASGLEDMAAEEQVDLRFVSERVGEERQLNDRGQKVFTLWDLYQFADMVTYPSIYEGFGNALLEAIYFRVPIVTNRYSIFIEDIEPKGFSMPVIDGFITSRVARPAIASALGRDLSMSSIIMASLMNLGGVAGRTSTFERL